MRLVTSAGSRTRTLLAHIYVVANPLRPDSRKRTKECIAAVRHRASDAVPPPNAILSTSFGKYQLLWRVEGFTVEQQESALKLLAITFGGDPACADCNRVLRLPGFLNCKYDPACRVTVEYPGDSTWNSDDFRLDILAADAILSSRAITPRKHSSNHTNSEHDWAWILRELARGKDAAKLTRKLALRGPKSRIRCTTRSEQLTLHRPDFGSSKAFR